MRNNRLIKLYPILKPKLEKVAFSLIKKYYWVDIDKQDLIQEGLIAIKNCNTTKKDPKNLSYLVRRAKLSMVKLINSEVFRHNYNKKLTFIIC